MSTTLYEFESNSAFNKEVIKTIESNLADMVGYEVVVDDLCNNISEYQSSDGFWIYGTDECMEFLRKYRLDAAEMFDDVLKNLGVKDWGVKDWGAVNPFSRPEWFVSLMFIQRASELISSAQWVIDNSGKTVRLTNQMVSDIVSEL